MAAVETNEISRMISLWSEYGVGKIPSRGTQTGQFLLLLSLDENEAKGIGCREMSSAAPHFRSFSSFFLRRRAAAAPDGCISTPYISGQE